MTRHDSVGRYKGVRGATKPGDLPPESAVRRAILPKKPAAAAKRGDAASERQRAGEAREAQAKRLATGRPEGQGAVIKHGAIADPNPALRGKRQRVAINIRTDSLEREYAAARISDAAYSAGRTYGRVLERSRRPISAAGGWNPGDHVDHADSHEEAIYTRIDDASKAVAMIADTAPAIGLIGQRVLELALVDALTLTEIATRLRGPGKQHVVYVSAVFRDSCEALADHWAQRGNRAPR